MMEVIVLKLRGTISGVVSRFERLRTCRTNKKKTMEGRVIDFEIRLGSIVGQIGVSNHQYLSYRSLSPLSYIRKLSMDTGYILILFITHYVRIYIHIYTYLYHARRINRQISRLLDAKFRNLKEQAKLVFGDFNVLYR